MPPAFNHEPLRSGEVRLLTLKDIEQDGSPSYTMSQVHLDSKPQFYALSYVWGSGLRSQSVRCDSCELRTTESVSQALADLQPILLDSRLPIWIDGICINQDDTSEKAYQVALMHRVYRQAKKVIVWLGPEADASDIAMGAIASLASAFSALTGVPDPDRCAEYGLPDNASAVWPALGCLFARSWFFRVWTFQEILLSTAAEVVCGQHRASWRNIQTVGDFIHHCRLWPLTVSDKTKEVQFRGFTSVANIVIMRNNMITTPQEEPYLPFAKLLPLAQAKQCTESRDRVYALLSITSQSFRDKFSIDYQIPLRDLYVQCGKACLEQDSRLLYLQLHANQQERLDLPSWCLDLRSQELEMIFDNYLRAGLREASGDLNRTEVQFPHGSDDLELRGFKADTVAYTIPRVPWPHQRTQKSAQDIVDWEAKCRLLACSSLGVSSDETPIEHICTLAAHLKNRHNVDFAALSQAYQDQITHITSQAQGKGSKPPPAERRSPWDYFWVQMVHTCPGRVYFSTKNGRVGIGPPRIQPGDTIVVIYGTEPTFILRQLPHPNSKFKFIGDAFVQGLMDLNETPEEAIGPTESFVIC